MKVIHIQAVLDICCGLDVHKDSVVACIIKTINSQRQDEVTKEIRTSKTFLNDLTALKDWIESENFHHATMESTGVYWYPVYDAIEPSFKSKNGT